MAKKKTRMWKKKNQAKRAAKAAAARARKEAEKAKDSSKIESPKKTNKNELSAFPQSNDQLLHALFESFMMARRGKLKTEDQQRFEANWMENLMQLRDDIVDRTYRPGRSKAFVTHEPVDREIFAAPFRDRIVHHLLYAIVSGWWNKRFIYTSSSCRVGKGTDFAVEQMQRAMRRASMNGQMKAYVIKGDISGYFMSLSRRALYRKVKMGLDKQFPKKGWLHELCDFLWGVIIYDDPTFGVRMAGSFKDWEALPYNKSLFNQPEGQGIVIGNLTSQLLSNIFLNNFDWFMKRKMGFHYYGRYVDDFYVIVPEKDLERARAAFRKEVPEFLTSEGLTLHPKKYYEQEVHRGCPFLGKVVHLDAKLPGKRFRRNARKAIRAYTEGRASYETVASYVGMSKNMSAKKFMKKLFDDCGGEYRF